MSVEIHKEFPRVESGCFWESVEHFGRRSVGGTVADLVASRNGD